MSVLSNGRRLNFALGGPQPTPPIVMGGRRADSLLHLRNIFNFDIFTISEQAPARPRGASTASQSRLATNRSRPLHLRCTPAGRTLVVCRARQSIAASRAITFVPSRPTQINHRPIGSTASGVRFDADRQQLGNTINRTLDVQPTFILLRPRTGIEHHGPNRPKFCSK